MTNTQQFIKVYMFGIQWKNNKGFTVMEIIVVTAVMSLILVTILGLLSLESKISEQNRLKLKAIATLEETIESVKNFRDNTAWFSTGIGGLVVGSNYYPVIASSGWSFVLGTETTDGFTRSIIFSSVSRDADSNIESSYNSVNDDPDTKKATITVSWNDRTGSKNETLITYVTNWQK